MRLVTAVIFLGLLFSVGVAAAPPDRAAAGVFVGEFSLGRDTHSLALVLEQRADGERILGVALGGVDSLLFLEGRRDGPQVSLPVVLRSPDGTRQIEFQGRVTPQWIRGNVHDGSRVGRFALRLTETPLLERSFVFVELDSDGEPTALLRASVATTPGGGLAAGRFVAGGEVSFDPVCPAAGCGGEVVGFREIGDDLEITFRTGGECPGETRIDVVFDATEKLYSGTFRTVDCSADRAGAIIGARTTQSRSEHARQILARLARLGDDLESDVPLTAPHPTFSSEYLHSGRDLDDLLGGFEEERLRFSSRRVTYQKVRGLYTVADSLTYPEVDLPPPGAAFDERREGVPVGSIEPQLYLDSHLKPFIPLLSVWAEEEEGWVIRGNGFAGIDLPFEYHPAGGALEVPTPGGGTVFVGPGPYGAHTAPHTGHFYGDAKANFVGYMVRDFTEMTDLGNGDGIRDPREPWGLCGDSDGEVVRSRIPVYRAPADAVLEEIRYNSGPTGVYFDDAPHWQVTIRFADDTVLSLGHLGSITETFQHRVLAEMGIDLASYAGPPGVVVDRENGMRVSEGEELALPQVMAAEVEGFPGCFASQRDGNFDPPWAQMEFQMIGPAGHRDFDVCVYEFIPRVSHAAVQEVLDTAMADPASLRFGPYQDQRWLWAAEGRACMSYSPAPDDFSTLDSRMGGWFEIASPGIPSDEIVAFIAIAKDVAGYDPELYDSPNVERLVRRQRTFGLHWTWVMPDRQVVQPFYPAGEVLQQTDSTLLIQWRDIGYLDSEGRQRPAYQWASYRLGEEGLKVLWGPFLDRPEDGAAPPLGPLTPCNGNNVVCYDHTFQPGF